MSLRSSSSRSSNVCSCSKLAWAISKYACFICVSDIVAPPSANNPVYKMIPEISNAVKVESNKHPPRKQPPGLLVRIQQAGWLFIKYYLIKHIILSIYIPTNQTQYVQYVNFQYYSIYLPFLLYKNHHVPPQEFVLLLYQLNY